MSQFIFWTAWFLLLSGLATECGAMVATKYYSLARCGPLMALGFYAFFLGGVLLGLTTAFGG